MYAKSCIAINKNFGGLFVILPGVNICMYKQIPRSGQRNTAIIQNVCMTSQFLEYITTNRGIGPTQKKRYCMHLKTYSNNFLGNDISLSGLLFN